VTLHLKVYLYLMLFRVGEGGVLTLVFICCKATDAVSSSVLSLWLMIMDLF